MVLMRLIANQFNLVYLKPSVMVRAISELAPGTHHSQADQQQRRVNENRRCGLDRRQTKRHVMVNMRSSYSRRKHSSRRDMEDNAIGIDVYA